MNFRRGHFYDIIYNEIYSFFYIETEEKKIAVEEKPSFDSVQCTVVTAQKEKKNLISSTVT